MGAAVDDMSYLLQRVITDTFLFGWGVPQKLATLPHIQGTTPGAAGAAAAHLDLTPVRAVELLHLATVDYAFAVAEQV